MSNTCKNKTVQVFINQITPNPIMNYRKNIAITNTVGSTQVETKVKIGIITINTTILVKAINITPHPPSIITTMKSLHLEIKGI